MLSRWMDANQAHKSQQASIWLNGGRHIAFNMYRIDVQSILATGEGTDFIYKYEVQWWAEGGCQVSGGGWVAEWMVISHHRKSRSDSNA